MTVRDFNPRNTYQGVDDCPVLGVTWEPDYDHGEGLNECAVRIQREAGREGYLFFSCPEHAIWIACEISA